MLSHNPHITFRHNGQKNYDFKVFSAPLENYNSNIYPPDGSKHCNSSEMLENQPTVFFSLIETSSLTVLVITPAKWKVSSSAWTFLTFVHEQEIFVRDYTVIQELSGTECLSTSVDFRTSRIEMIDTATGASMIKRDCFKLFYTCTDHAYLPNNHLKRNRDVEVPVYVGILKTPNISFMLPLKDKIV